MEYQVSGDKSTIKGFTDLIAWQEGHRFALMLYKVTKQFSSDEKWGLTDQIRRAAVSITSNIAEGFARSTSADKARFYDMSLGSIAEVQNQLLIARDLQYLDHASFDKIADQSIQAQKLASGLRKAVANGKGVRAKPA